MWRTINILIFIISAASTYYGWREGQQSEAYHALLPFFGGLLLLVVGIISSAVKAIWFSS